MIGPLSVHIEAFRSKGQELRAKAASTSDPVVRDGFLRLAEEYDRLALHAEEWSVATKALIMGLTAPDNE
jgi:hypothetical protein